MNGSFTPQDVAALMGDDIRENNGLKNLRFTDSMAAVPPKRTIDEDYQDIHIPYRLPSLPKKMQALKPVALAKAKPVVMESTPTPKPTGPQTVKFGMVDRMLAI